MSGAQIGIMIAVVLTFVVLGFSLNRSIKKLEARPKTKKKKGRSKYMPQAKTPGK